MTPKVLHRFPATVQAACSRVDGGVWREYVRDGDGWVDKGPCKHDHSFDERGGCCCVEKGCAG